MEKLLTAVQNDFILLIICFVFGSAFLFFYAKTRAPISDTISSLELVKIFLANALGKKGEAILDIWIEGLKKIEDGEFSNEDAVDQFVRFIKLGAVQKGIELTEEDTEKIELLVLSTFEKFVSKKPKQINIAVNKFNAMNHR
jgi:hypothetical protein